MWVGWKGLLFLKTLLGSDHSSIYSFSQQTFIEHLHVPGIVLGAGDTAVNKTKRACGELTF